MTIALPKPEAERRVVLDGISWGLYQQMLAEIGDGHTRLTYDQGRLEIMSPGPRHERVKKILARLVEAYGEELDIAVEGFGSTTFDREDLQKGLEPDECYYVANAERMAGREEFDFAVDPPPDLAIEIDISPPQVGRQPIYGALGVPEIWRYDGNLVTPLHRTPAGTYITASHSLAFPELSMAELNRFLRIGLEQGQSAAVRALRRSVQESRSKPQS
jgi:Uma2 family endonuclease